MALKRQEPEPARTAGVAAGEDPAAGNAHAGTDDAREAPAYVYIAECSDGSWYTGWTRDPERRIRAHNSGRGARYTRSRLPVKLIYTERCADKGAALRREYEIKQMTRKEKERLVWGDCSI